MKFSCFLIGREELTEVRSREQAVREGGDTDSELEELRRTLHQLQADLQAAEQNSAQVSQSWNSWNSAPASG